LRKAIYEAKSPEQIVDAVEVFFGRQPVESEELRAVPPGSDVQQRCV
jgi:hypothetical protein